MGPWSLRTSDDPDIQAGSYTYVFGAAESETAYEVTIALEMSGETAAERFLGCFMIGMMPDQGLEEALYSLRDMLKFYNEESLGHVARLKPERISGTVIGRKKRPDLVIS